MIQNYTITVRLKCPVKNRYNDNCRFLKKRTLWLCICFIGHFTATAHNKRNRFIIFVKRRKKHIIQAIRKNINMIGPKAEVILYGSRARGDERPDSDWGYSSVNRLSYAVFYAVNALLVLNNMTTKSHSSTKSQFSLYFITTGKFDKKYGKLLTELYDWRKKGDYDNVFDIKRIDPGIKNDENNEVALCT